VEQKEVKKMDKMTCVKFNGDNFALSLSGMMDKIIPKKIASIGVHKMSSIIF